MDEEIRYFSMFTGVGGFELGIENSRSSTNLQGRWNENSRSTKNLQSEWNNSSNETTRYTCVGFSEIDKYASQLLADKFPNVKNYGDATRINPSELPDFDMLCGGFPCQAFSIAGKRRGFEDTRGTMFFEVARIIKIKRPKIVFLENVKGLLNHNKGETFKVILETLDELGYETQWMVLNSKFFGVPQNRERVFIIGSIRGEPRPEILPFRTNNSEITEQYTTEVSNTITQRYYKQGNADTYVREKFTEGSQGMRVYDTNGTSTTLAGNAGGLGGKTGLYCIPVLTPDRLEKRQKGYCSQATSTRTGSTAKQQTIINQGQYQNMLSTKTRDVNEALMVGKVIANQENKPVQIDLFHLKHGEIRPLSTYIPQNEDARCVQAGEPKEILIEPSMKIRRLTPTECERLQGFPDGWTIGFSDTQRYKMMGNAVTVNVIKAIAGKLFRRKVK